MRFAPPPLMLFAAGLGTRMLPLTATRPKPLIPVAGRPLIDHALDLAEATGVKRIVANSHYLPEQIEAHLSKRGIPVSRETPVLLDTGGGLKRALPLLDGDPVMTLNTDAVWTGQNPLQELLSTWDPARMDGLLLLLPVSQTKGHAGTGDFLMDAEGRLMRASGRPGLVYLGAQIIRTRGLAEVGEDVFSLNLLWDRMIAAGRLRGMIHDGGWCDVGRPEGIALAEAMLEGGA